MQKTYELYARLHTGFFDEGDIYDLENNLPDDVDCRFDNIRISDDSMRVMFFDFTCEFDPSSHDGLQNACVFAGETLYQLGYELWEVNSAEELV